MRQAEAQSPWIFAQYKYSLKKSHVAPDELLPVNKHGNKFLLSQQSRLGQGVVENLTHVTIDKTVLGQIYNAVLSLRVHNVIFSESDLLHSIQGIQIDEDVNKHQ